MANHDPRLKLHDDRPSASGDDLYHRRTFVRRLTQAVARRTQTSPFIIGIEGAWGEGKSTVLEYMAQELHANHRDVVLVRFNPWAYGSQDQMLLGLVQLVAERLRENTRKSVRKLAAGVLGLVGSAAELAGSVSGQGHLEKGGAATRKLADALGQEDSFPKQKAALEAKLRTAQTQVVVLVDDLDRLDHEAIRSVFRLLKAVFDLPSFTYILAYDPDIIAAALEAHFESRGALSGRRYLEKIVQLPLALPRLDPLDLEEDLFANLVGAFEDNGLPQSAEEIVEMRRLAKVLSTHLATPREIRRLGNAVRFALPILRGETNPVDVCRVEALRVLFPELFEQVLRHSDLLTDTGFLARHTYRRMLLRDGGANPIGGPLPVPPPGPLHEVFGGFPPAAKQLLGMAFPNAALAFDLHEPGRYSGPYAAHQPEYLKRYLQYAIGSDDVEDALTRQFIQDTVHRKASAEATLGALDAKRLPRFLGKIALYARPLESEERLALTLVLAGHFYESYVSFGSHAMPLLTVRDTVVEVLEQGVGRESSGERWEVLERLLKDLPEWWMSLDLFEACSSLLARESRSGREAVAQPLRDWLADLLHRHQTQLMQEPRAILVSALRLLAERHGRSLTHALVLDFVGERSDHAQRWLLALARQVRVEAGALPSRFSIEQYLMLEEVVDMDELLERLEPLVPEVEGLAATDEVMARIMFDRLLDIRPDAKEFRQLEAKELRQRLVAPPIHKSEHNIE
ncbi:KAP family P-loop NTPase fold protein [Deinococcus koreensis]|uniref:KAP NTPase domain-containing protein n=1 Tax=Deinococcus koreensis TaxID=2054903 RepID=A0A2K3URM8_9DEIO|nr:P-loop NTPase fold protein [Deinococcus koreensis]PNY79174.1 hypothetical protein CVO96_20450 [Deinococcus koreensis]